MVVTSDHGNPRNVHPREKRAVGARLARLALAKTYVRDLLPGGPEPLAATVGPDLASGRVRLTFAHTGAALRSSDGAAPRGFEVAGDDGKFHPAEAKFDGGSMLLTAPAVASPRQVRYAWTPVSDGNLANSESLPASTFGLRVATAD
jgi:sialate O-acetylesterase